LNTDGYQNIMKTNRIKIFFFLIALLATGCKKNLVISENQAVLFQVEYVNYSSSYQHSGFIIDSKGNVLTYNNPENWNFPDKELTLSESQVKENLGKCINTGKKIPDVELRKYAGYIRNISSSKVTALKNVATDEGSIQYICYQFSDKSRFYKGCLIKMEGDFTCENLNFFSKKVSAWLKNINGILPKK
jgi:hypothetical protein